MTTQIVREKTCCHHMGYTFRLAARDLLYAPSHREDVWDGMHRGMSTYTSCVVLDAQCIVGCVLTLPAQCLRRNASWDVYLHFLRSAWGAMHRGMATYTSCVVFEAECIMGCLEVQCIVGCLLTLHAQCLRRNASWDVYLHFLRSAWDAMHRGMSTYTSCAVLEAQCIVGCLLTLPA